MCVLGHSHYENVLLALLASPDKEDRKFGIDKILKLRNGKEIGDLSVRYQKTPKLNLKATPYKILFHGPVEISMNQYLHVVSPIKNLQTFLRSHM